MVSRSFAERLRPFIRPCSEGLTPLDWAIKIAILVAIALVAYFTHGHH